MRREPCILGRASRRRRSHLLEELVLLILLCIIHSQDDGSWKLTFPPWGESNSSAFGWERIIIPLVGPFTKDACFPTSYMAIRIATSHLNRRDATLCPAIASLVSHFELAYELADTGAESVGTLEAISKLQQLLRPLDMFKVLLGPDGSDASKVASRLLSVYGIPQISWGARSNALSDRRTYPNFVRGIAPDRHIVQKLVLCIKAFNYTKANLIHSDGDRERGQADDFCNSVGEIGGLHIRSFMIPSSALIGPFVSSDEHAAMRTGVFRTIKSSDIRVNVACTSTEESMNLFLFARNNGLMSGAGWAWFASDAIVGDQFAVDADAAAAFDGTIFALDASLGLEFDRFRTLWAEIMPYTQTPEFTSQKVCLGNVDCNTSADFIGWGVGSSGPSGPQSSPMCGTSSAFAYDAMVTIAVVLDQLLMSRSDFRDLTSADILQGVRNLSDPRRQFKCLSGDVRMNTNQERETAVSFYNWQEMLPEPVLVASWQYDSGLQWAVGNWIRWPSGDKNRITDATTPPDHPLGAVVRSCPPMQFWNRDYPFCPCGPGFVKNETSSVCMPCPPGTTSYPQAGSSVCFDCLPGTMAEVSSSSVCEQCSLGRFSYNPASTACVSCGTASSGIDFTTASKGAISRAECICPNGFFRPKGTDVCIECTDGMTCEAGSAFPMQVEGFFVVRYSDMQYEAYRCDPESCLAGLPGTCVEGRAQFACGTCVQGHYPDSFHSCTRCEGAYPLFPVGAMVLGFGFFVVLCIYRRTDSAWQDRNGLTMFSVCGQTILALQMMYSCHEHFHFPEPMATVVQILSANLDIIRLSCFGTFSPLWKYVLTILLTPFLCGYFFIVSCLLRRLRRRAHRHSSIDCFGLITMLLYYPISLTILQPFACTRNPSGTESMEAMKNVVCWENDHLAMVICAVASTLAYPILVLCGIILLSWKYPSWIARGLAELVFCRYRFVFQRFTLECYFYPPIYLLRSCLLAFIPPVFPQLAPYQTISVLLTLIVFGLVEAGLRPWRTAVANILNAFLTTMVALVVVLSGFVWCHSNCAEVRRFDVGPLTLAIVVFTFAIWVVVLLYLTVVCIRKQARAYHIFWCHHWSSTAKLARFFTMTLNDHHVPTYLNSDVLPDLHGDLDVVRHRTEKLVAILTEYTLRSVWCAAELTTAHKSNVRIILLSYPGYDGLSDVFNEVHSYWTNKELEAVSAAFVTRADIKSCYIRLKELPIIFFPHKIRSKGDLEKLRDVARRCSNVNSPQSTSFTSFTTVDLKIKASMKLLKGWKPRRILGQDLIKDNPGSFSVAIIVAHSGREAIVGVAILGSKINSMTKACTTWKATLLFTPDDVILTSELERPMAVIVTLCSDCFSNLLFAATLCKAERMWPICQKVTVAVVAAFSFPTKEDFRESIVPLLARNSGIDDTILMSTFMSLLHLTAFSFDADGSQAVMNDQVEWILFRIWKQYLSDDQYEPSEERRARQLAGRACDAKGTELAVNEQVTIGGTHFLEYSVGEGNNVDIAFSRVVETVQM